MQRIAASRSSYIMGLDLHFQNSVSSANAFLISPSVVLHVIIYVFHLQLAPLVSLDSYQLTATKSFQRPVCLVSEFGSRLKLSSQSLGVVQALHLLVNSNYLSLPGVRSAANYTQNLRHNCPLPFNCVFGDQINSLSCFVDSISQVHCLRLSQCLSASFNFESKQVFVPCFTRYPDFKSILDHYFSDCSSLDTFRMTSYYFFLL